MNALLLGCKFLHLSKTKKLLQAALRVGKNADQPFS